MAAIDGLVTTLAGPARTPCLGGSDNLPITDRNGTALCVGDRVKAQVLVYTPDHVSAQIRTGFIRDPYWGSGVCSIYGPDGLMDGPCFLHTTEEDVSGCLRLRGEASHGALKTWFEIIEPGQEETRPLSLSAAAQTMASALGVNPQNDKDWRFLWEETRVSPDKAIAHEAKKVVNLVHIRTSAIFNHVMDRPQGGHVTSVDMDLPIKDPVLLFRVKSEFRTSEARELRNQVASAIRQRVADSAARPESGLEPPMPQATPDAPHKGQSITTEILSNGSKWAGEAPDPIEVLFDRLEKNTLLRRFSPFIHDQGLGRFSFRGNFIDVSHNFNIQTNDPAVIDQMTRAIRKNEETPEFLEQSSPEEIARADAEYWKSIRSKA